jgi:hypothetical protein
MVRDAMLRIAPHHEAAKIFFHRLSAQFRHGRESMSGLPDIDNQ